MRKRVAFLSVLLGTGMVFGGVTVSADNSGEEKTIHILTSQSEDEGGTQIIKQLSDEYAAENPNFKVEFEVVAQSDMDQKLSVLAASDDLPDVFLTGTYDYIKTYAEQGMLVNVREFMEETGSTGIMSEGTVAALKNMTALDDLYVLPTEYNIEGIFYNKEIFEQYDLQVPTTVDELMTICETLSENGVQPFTSAGKEQWPLTRLMGAYVTQKAGTQALVDANRGELSWGSDAFLEAYQWMSDMGTKEYFGKGVTTLDTDTANSLFLTGKAAMLYNGSWFASNLNSDANTLGENVGFFAFPALDGGKGTGNNYVVSYGMFWCVNNKNYDADMADWMKYVFEHYGDAAMETQGTITAYTMNEEHETPYYTQMLLDAMELGGDNAVWPEFALPASVQKVEFEDIQLIVLGQIDPELMGEDIDLALADYLG